jgi:hypothetical protein
MIKEDEDEQWSSEERRAVSLTPGAPVQLHLLR